MNKQQTLLLKQLTALLDGESDYLANAANLSSFLFHQLETINWLGFYFQKDQQLVLGPFHGQPACTRLAIGQGVCGTAFANKETLTVSDVTQFSGHVYCDTASQSEVVVPFYHDTVSGVLDIDSPDLNRFSAEDAAFFEAVVTIFLSSLD